MRLASTVSSTPPALGTTLPDPPHVGLAASFRDPDSYAAAVHNCRARILSTGRGVFRARLMLARLPELSLFLGRETVARRAIVAYRPDRAFFAITADSDPPGTQGGAVPQPGSIRVSAGLPELEEITTGPAVSRSLSVPLVALVALLARAEQGLDGAAAVLAGTPATFFPDQTVIARLARLHEDLTQHAASLPDQAATGPHLAAMAGTMWDLLLEALDSALPARPAQRLVRGRATMRRMVEYIDANADRPARLGELAAVAGCSVRTLETLFQEFVGDTPSRYLRRWRMWRAHAQLATADPDATTVADVATGCGFWELGRFSVAYRELFGESPSRTLRGSGREARARSMPPFAHSA